MSRRPRYSRNIISSMNKFIKISEVRLTPYDVVLSSVNGYLKTQDEINKFNSVIDDLFLSQLSQVNITEHDLSFYNSIVQKVLNGSNLSIRTEKTVVIKSIEADDTEAEVFDPLTWEGAIDIFFSSSYNMSILLKNLRRSLPRELITDECEIVFSNFVNNHQSQVASDYQWINTSQSNSNKTALTGNVDYEIENRINFGFDHLTRLDWGVVSSVAALAFFGLLLSSVFLRIKPQMTNIRQEENSGSGNSVVNDNITVGGRSFFSAKKFREALSISSMGHLKRNTATTSTQASTNDYNLILGEISETVGVFFEELNSKNIKFFENSLKNLPFFVARISRNTSELSAETYLNAKTEEAETSEQTTVDDEDIFESIEVKGRFIGHKSHLWKTIVAAEMNEIPNEKITDVQQPEKKSNYVNLRKPHNSVNQLCPTPAGTIGRAGRQFPQDINEHSISPFGLQSTTVIDNTGHSDWKYIPSCTAKIWNLWACNINHSKVCEPSLNGITEQSCSQSERTREQNCSQSDIWGPGHLEYGENGDDLDNRRIPLGSYKNKGECHTFRNSAKNSTISSETTPVQNNVFLLKNKEVQSSPDNGERGLTDDNTTQKTGWKHTCSAYECIEVSLVESKHEDPFRTYNEEKHLPILTHKKEKEKNGFFMNSLIKSNKNNSREALSRQSQLPKSENEGCSVGNTGCQFSFGNINSEGTSLDSYDREVPYIYSSSQSYSHGGNYMSSSYN